MPGRVQLSGQQTARSSAPSHPWGPPGTDRLTAFVPFILLQSGLGAGYFKLVLRFRGQSSEQNQHFKRLITVKIKANRKKALPALANGQLWKTEDAYIQIVELGKRLIDYR